MAVTVASAPAKIILFGEHAVVYGRPAIAVPISQVRAEAIVEDSQTPGIRLRAPDLGLENWLKEAHDGDPFARAVHIVLESATVSRLPNLTITVRSTIPIASGLGSGAAMAAAVIRSLAQHLDMNDLATDQQVSALCYQVEGLLHGTPSGIDNTVVAYERPVFFVRQEPSNRIDTFTVATPLHILVADTGQLSMTRDVVGDVRRQWQADPEKFEQLFDSCGRVADEARVAIQEGDPERVGLLMQENQVYLREMTVSSDRLEQLIAAAISAGALGAKLSGAGRGGNMIALVDKENEVEVRNSLLSAGANSVLISVLT
jgi:mevalonate kinase